MLSRADFKVLKAEQLLTRNNKPYCALELLESREKGGRRWEAKIWDDALSRIPRTFLPVVGQFWANVQSEQNDYQGKKQLIIRSYSLVHDSVMTAEEKAQFEEPPVVDVERVIDRMFFWPFWDSELRDLMFAVGSELRTDGVWDKLLSIPAGAAYHHSVKGGFLLHIDELLNFADRLCNVFQYERGIADPSKDVVICTGVEHYEGIVDYQILRAAIVLHDIGKAYDYDAETLQYSPNPVSDCLEHTLVGISLVDRHWPDSSAESVDRGLRLKHAIAAHHGKEMGAVVPKTPEAILLHHLDMISACLDVCRKAYREVKNGSVPEYSKMLGTRPFVPAFFPSEEQVTYLSLQALEKNQEIFGDS